MTDDQLLKGLDKVQDNLLLFLERGLVEMGFDLLQDVQSRIQSSGTKADGSKLKPYSSSYLAFKKNPKGTKRGKELGLGSSRYSGVVDYTLTSRMWNSLSVFPVSVGEKEIRVRIGTRDKDSQKKLSELSKRDSHNPLEPSEMELQAAFTRLAGSIPDIIQREL